MNLDDAYEVAMAKVNEMRELGIQVSLEPSRSRKIQRTLDKYGTRQDRLPPEKWFHISFYPSNEGQTMALQNAKKYLAQCGISFDTGGSVGLRDWELDWSFQVGKDEEWIDRDESVEDILNYLEKKS